MDVQDNGGTDSNTIAISGNRNCLDVETQSVTGVQPKEIYSSGDEHAPKVRKPYTITKQREKWTEEEHKKFLEALKLYGRAWRRIEEHVGTKTAVQIRSHAQKFFSKVVRESSASNADSVKQIEIPPPRPKRKPMHPYPRKLVHLIKRGISVAEQPERSPSPNLSVSDQANQSPKSVLSAVGSDTMGYADSNLENGSLSPVSSTSSANPLSLLLTEQENGDLPSTSLAEEEDGSPMVLVISDSISQKQFGMKVSLGSEDNTGNKEDSTSKAPPMSFKLFGRTVLVTDSHKPSSTTEGTHKSLPAQGCQENADRNEENPLQTSQWNLMQTDFAVGTNKGTGSSWPCEAPPVLYYMQSQKEEPYQVEAASAAALPWWAMYGGLPFPFLRSPLPSSAQRPIDSCMEDATEDKAFHKEGSWTGSNSASVNDVGVGDKNGYVVDSGNHQEPTSRKEEKEPSPAFWLRQSETSAFSKPKPNPYNKCMKGFMPYKRCIAERDAQSSGIMGEEREGQKIRLCL